MKKILNSILFLVVLCFTCSCEEEIISSNNISNPDTTVYNVNARVPAEWEAQEAIWMQWPRSWEASLRPAFADIIGVVKQYEAMHLIANSASEKEAAIHFLSQKGIDQENITWHVHSIDNSWLRDNGPIYVNDGETTWIQNWKFDGWGTGFGNIPAANDNRIPEDIALYLNVEVESRQDYVLEKGNVEVNGNGILLINWDCQKDRNPKVSQAHQETLLKNALGLEKIIWAYGHYEGDGTIGHIDGTARFINENTVVIANYGSDLENNMAAACREEGLEVIMYDGDPNWLVGNGFVLAMGHGDSRDELLKLELEKFWPNREVHVIDGSKIVNLGGGIHCLTNDQPVL